MISIINLPVRWEKDGLKHKGYLTRDFPPECGTGSLLVLSADGEHYFGPAELRDTILQKVLGPASAEEVQEAQESGFRLK